MKVLTIFWCFLIWGAVNAQTVFVKDYDLGQSEDYREAILLPTGETIMAGVIVDEDLGLMSRERAVIMRLDAAGEPILEADFLDVPETDVRALAPRPGGGFYCLVGQRDATGDKAWTVYEADTNGALSAINSGGRPPENWSMDDMVVAENEDIIIAGTSTTSFGGPGVIIRFDRLGNIVYQSGFDIPGARNFQVTDIVNDGEGGQVISGECIVGTDQFELFTLKIDATGEVIWSKRYQIMDARLFSRAKTRLLVNAEGAIFITRDVFTTSGESGAVILKLTTTGELLGTRISYHESIFSSFGDVLLEPDGTLLMVVDNGIGETKFIRLGSDLEVLDSRIFGTGQFSGIQRILRRENGAGYLLAGRMSSCSFERRTDMRLISLDSDLSFGPDACQSTEVASEVLPISVGAEDDGITTFVSSRSLVVGSFDRLPVDRLAWGCDFVRPETINTIVPCNEDVLSVNFLADGQVFPPDGNLPGLIVELTDPNDPGRLSLPDSFGIVPPIFQNDRRVQYSRLNSTDPFSIAEALSAVTYSAPDVTALNGPHQVRVTVPACGVTEIRFYTFNVETAPPVPRLSPGFDTTICLPGSLQLTATPYPRTAYAWNTGVTDNQITVDTPGAYSVSTSNRCGADTATFNVMTASPDSLVEQVENLAFCLGDSVRFVPDVDNETSLVWEDGFAGTTRIFSAPGQFTLLTSNGCFEATTTVNVVGESCCKVYVPNAFSPNEDGVNDRFGAFPGMDNCSLVENLELRVFNRWGGLVYEGDGRTGWDGYGPDRQPANAGPYVFQLWYFDGQNLVERSGNVQLLR
ncbi:T9SS type B sorting domain-containing protein [Neolewinella persica]|uniref:T9SS type B sorting domain-containing protein n=1 Tax=Neolewinella persica TaxID=70998 RepID=UPI000374D6E4|nr:gliding motility-associated C-terminal domain-containing protein [Neolewinella persica]